MPTVTLPITTGTARATSLHPEPRQNENGATPFASLLDTGTGPQIVNKSAPPPPARARTPDKHDAPAQKDTAPAASAPAPKTRDEAENDSSDDAPAPPLEAKPADPAPDGTKDLLAALEAAVDASTVDVTADETDPSDAATADDAKDDASDDPADRVLAVVTATATLTETAVAPVQAAPVDVTSTPEDTNEGDAVVAVTRVATDSAPTAAVAAKTDTAPVPAAVQPDPDAALANAEPEAKPKAKSDAKAEQAAGKIVPPTTGAEKSEGAPAASDKIAASADTPKEAAPAKPHVQTDAPSEAPAEHKPAATRKTIETAVEQPAHARASSHNDPTANLVARPDATLQTNATLPAIAAAAPAAAQAQAPAAVPVPVSGLAVEIVTQAREGKNRFEIRLDPPDLGRVDVRLDIDGQGNVTSRLVVERQDTLDLLRRESQALERALQDAGLKTGNDGLQFSLRDQGFNNQAQRDDTSGSRTSRVVVPDSNGGLPDPSAYRLPRLGGLDIRV